MDLDAESKMSLAEVVEHRLRLAVTLLGWSTVRVKAFREGMLDGRAGSLDRVRMHLHSGDEHGFVERDMGEEVVDSLGYRDGSEAAAALLERVEDLSTDPDELMQIAYRWAENGDNDFEIDEATWTATSAEDLAPFLRVMSRADGIAWLVREHEAATADGRPGYGDLLMQDVRVPVVWIEYEDSRVDVWDGYHRIAAAMAKGAGHIPSVKGVPAERTPVLAP